MSNKEGGRKGVQKCSSIIWMTPNTSYKKSVRKMLIKLNLVVNFTDILQVAFLPISKLQKIEKD